MQTVLTLHSSDMHGFQFPLVAAKSLQSCPTLCDPIDGSTPGSHQHTSTPGILQARTLEWVVNNMIQIVVTVVY